MSELKIPTLVVSGKMANMGESLGAIRQFVTNASQQAGLDKQAMYRLILAVDEIATNILSYGYNDSYSDPQIGIHASISDGRLTVTLEDSAAPFDPTVRPPRSEEDINMVLDERDIGGWGVELARQNVDEFRYEYVNGRNCNIFVMNRHTAQ